MEKIVTSGMRDCTINLDGECAVKFGSPYRVFSVQNNSDNDVIVSIYEGKAAEDDGVRIIHSGESGMLAHMRSDVDTLYITGSGSVAVAAGNEAVNPFKSDGKGGESWVNANGNPVTLGNLQGGVPFNEITVSGKNLFVPVAGYALYGGITAGFRLRATNNAFSHVAKIRNNTDYTIKSYSDGNRMNVILFKNDPYTLAKDDNFKRLLWQTTPPIAIKEITFNSENYNYAVLTIASEGSDIDTLIKDAQLEYGTEPTAYEPPITGREMQLRVSGKNLLPNVSLWNVFAYNGLNIVINSDGGILLSGTNNGAGFSEVDIIPKSNKIMYPAGKYIMSYGSDIPKSDGRMIIDCYDSNGAYIKTYAGENNAPFEISKSDVDNNYFVRIYVRVYKDKTVNTIFYPQIEFGTSVTAYETPKGVTSYTITPDTNPYTVPMDITQADGENVLSISDDSQPIISVNANKKNPQLAKIYEKINDELAAQTEMIMSLSAELESRLDGGA